MRQSRNYGALHETHREADEQQNSRAASHQPRNYDALRETQHQVDEQRNPSAEMAGPQVPERLEVLRSWTHLGGMVPQQESANDWIRQNYEIRMAENEKPGSGREAERTESTQNREQDQAEVQEARAAIEDARRREAAERVRQQERDRGPER